jgi:hypothetical protein
MITERAEKALNVSCIAFTASSWRFLYSPEKPVQSLSKPFHFSLNNFRKDSGNFKIRE